MQGIYQPAGKAAEYCENAVNFYIGCTHSCSYCYVPALKHMTRKSFSIASVRPGIIEQIKEDAPAYANKEVLLCFTCDPYQRLNCYEQLTRQAMEVFLENKIIPTVLTKGGMKSMADFDFLKKAGGRYGATLTFLNEESSLHYEPGASIPKERLFALQQAKKVGIATWASLEPVIDPEQSLRIIEETKDFVDVYKIGRWNHSTEANLIDWKAFGNRAIEILEKYNLKYYIKKDLRKYL